MDYHLLTVGLQTYSSDKRFFTRIGKNGQVRKSFIKNINNSNIYDVARKRIKTFKIIFRIGAFI